MLKLNINRKKLQNVPSTFNYLRLFYIINFIYQIYSTYLPIHSDKKIQLERSLNCDQNEPNIEMISTYTRFYKKILKFNINREKKLQNVPSTFNYLRLFYIIKFIYQICNT